MERNVRESKEENKQKMDLALACVYFLKVVTNISSLRGILRGNQVLNAMRRSLIAEQKYADESLIPIEIECTWSGRFLDSLLLCTTGNDALPAYNIVSYRIIARIADVLQGKTKEFPLDLGSCYDKEDLRRKTQEEFMQKIKKEFYIWEDDISEENLTAMIKNMDESEKESFIKQHSFFSSQNGLEKILMFLLGKTASNQAAILEKQLLKEFDQKYSNNFIKDEIEKESKKFVEEEIRLINEEERKKKTGKLQEKDLFTKNRKVLLENVKFFLAPIILLNNIKNKNLGFQRTSTKRK